MDFNNCKQNWEAKKQLIVMLADLKRDINTIEESAYNEDFGQAIYGIVQALHKIAIVLSDVTQYDNAKKNE